MIPTAFKGYMPFIPPSGSTNRPTNTNPSTPQQRSRSMSVPTASFDRHHSLQECHRQSPSPKKNSPISTSNQIPLFAMIPVARSSKSSTQTDNSTSRSITLISPQNSPSSVNRHSSDLQKQQSQQKKMPPNSSVRSSKIISQCDSSTSRQSATCSTSVSSHIATASFNKDDVLRKDQSWRALLRAVFRSKNSNMKNKSTEQNSSIDESLSTFLADHQTYNKNRRMSMPVFPIKRSNSVSSTRRNRIHLESIVEEDHTENSTSSHDVLSTSAPTSTSYIRDLSLIGFTSAASTDPTVSSSSDNIVSSWSSDDDLQQLDDVDEDNPSFTSRNRSRAYMPTYAFVL